MAWSLTASTVYADGPSVEPDDPDKELIRKLLKQYEDAIAALTQMTGAVAAKGTLAELQAVAGDFEEGDIGIVFTGDDAGVYMLVSGSWVKQSDLPSDTAQMAADAAAADRALAQAAAAVAVPAAATATAQAALAQASAAIAASYAGFSRPPYATKAAATADLANIPADGYIIVLVDETQGNVQTVYRKESGSLVLKVKAGRKIYYAEEFGAVGDNVTNDRTALQAADAFIVANGGEWRLTGGKTYFIGTAGPAVTFSGTIYAEEGSAIRGNIDLHMSPTLQTSLALDRNDGTNVYPRNWLSPISTSRLEQTLRPMGEADADRTVDVAINCFNLFHQRINWDGGSDTWSNFSPPLISAELVGYNLTNDGYFYGDFTLARGGDELSTVFDQGSYTRAAVLKTTHGVIILYCQADGDMSIATKTFGNAATVQTGVSWAGKADHESWRPTRSTWMIRLYDLRTYSILFNGREILAPRTLPAGQFITEIGFATKSSTSISSVAYDWVLTRGKKTSGRGFMDLLVIGDSTAASIFGDWPTALRNLHVEGSGGLSIKRLLNLAQDSATSLMQRDTLLAADITGYSHALVLLGTNDVQNPGAAGDLAAATSYLEDIIDHLQANNIAVTVGIFSMWYSKSLTPSSTGVTTFNYGQTGAYRQKYRRLAASKGCRIVDLNQELISALATFLPGAALQDVMDIYLRDNIHQTSLRNLLTSMAFSRTLLGWWPEKTRLLEPVALPASFYKNSWTASATFPPKMGMSPDGVVRLSGAVHSGTKTDGAVAFQLPLCLAPAVPLWFAIRSSQGTLMRVSINTSGEVLVYDINGDPAGVEVYLDQLNWQSI